MKCSKIEKTVPEYNTKESKLQGKERKRTHDIDVFLQLEETKNTISRWTSHKMR